MSPRVLEAFREARARVGQVHVTSQAGAEVLASRVLEEVWALADQGIFSPWGVASREQLTGLVATGEYVARGMPMPTVRVTIDTAGTPLERPVVAADGDRLEIKT